jgi:hypothetical protein
MWWKSVVEYKSDTESGVIRASWIEYGQQLGGGAIDSGFTDDFVMGLGGHLT